jgi:hypothetical protein
MFPSCLETTHAQWRLNLSKLACKGKGGPPPPLAAARKTKVCEIHPANPSPPLSPSTQGSALRTFPQMKELKVRRHGLRSSSLVNLLIFEGIFKRWTHAWHFILSSFMPLLPLVAKFLVLIRDTGHIHKYCCENEKYRWMRCNEYIWSSHQQD